MAFHDARVPFQRDYRRFRLMPVQATLHLDVPGATADTAVRLVAFFETDAQSWINLQAYYDAERARTLPADTLARIKPYRELQT